MDPFLIAAALGISTDAADKLRGELIDRAIKRLLDGLVPKIDPVERSLAVLEQHAIDSEEREFDVLCAPLREAVRRWQLGDASKALDRLFEAEAANPLAPMPRMLLALFGLSRDGVVSEGELLVADACWREAISLNPYIVDFVSSTATAVHLPTPTQDQHASWKPWSKDLDSREVIAALEKKFKWPKLWFWQRVDPTTRLRSSTVIRKLSVCGAYVAAQLAFASNFIGEVENAIALFRLDNGEPVWGRLNSGDELLFATYRHIVVYREKDKRYHLLNPATGDAELKMPPRYFATMFGASADQTAAYERSNWSSIISYEAAYAQSSSDPVPKRGSPDGHRNKPFPERRVLQDPCFQHDTIVEMENIWEHEHLAAGPNLHPYCHLVGGATLRSRRASNTPAGN